MKRLGGLILVASLLGLGASCAEVQGRRLVAEFQDVGDLVRRANVQSSDAVIGTISDIDLVRRNGAWLARVTMQLDEGVRVAAGTKAVVRSTSLLGEKFVDLVPPKQVSASTPALRDGAVIPVSRTDKAAELEEVFRQLGDVLAAGGLTDLGRVLTASARIVEGREDEIGRALDGTGQLVAALSSEREAIADALENLRSAATTLAGGSETTTRFLQTSDDALRVLSDQRTQLVELVAQLDRLGGVGARLLREHADETDRVIKALLKTVPVVHSARGSLDEALGRLAPFTELFARAAPGDYVQLYVTLESPAARAFHPLLWGAAR